MDEEMFTPDDWGSIDETLKRAGINGGIRDFILARDLFKCTFCEEPHTEDITERSNLHVHHIRPLSRGGGNGPTNLITLCAHCHQWVHHLMRRSEG